MMYFGLMPTQISEEDEHFRLGIKSYCNIDLQRDGEMTSECFETGTGAEPFLVLNSLCLG